MTTLSGHNKRILERVIQVAEHLVNSLFITTPGGLHQSTSEVNRRNPFGTFTFDHSPIFKDSTPCARVGFWVISWIRCHFRPHRDCPVMPHTALIETAMGNRSYRIDPPGKHSAANPLLPSANTPVPGS